jgi:hypothetical protein
VSNDEGAVYGGTDEEDEDEESVGLEDGVVA